MLRRVAGRAPAWEEWQGEGDGHMGVSVEVVEGVGDKKQGSCVNRGLVEEGIELDTAFARGDAAVGKVEGEVGTTVFRLEQ